MKMSVDGERNLLAGREVRRLSGANLEVPVKESSPGEGLGVRLHQGLDLGPRSPASAPVLQKPAIPR